MKVLHVVTDTDRRGAQVFALDLEDAMRRQGHVSETVAMAAGMQHPALDVEILGPSRYSWRTIRELRRKMRTVDVTIGHGSDTLLVCAIAGLGRRRQWVYRQISDTRFWAGTWSRRLRVAAMLRPAAKVIALSSADADDVVEHLWKPRDRVVVIPNGVPTDGFEPPDQHARRQARQTFGLPDMAFIVLDIGALVPEKGVDVAIRAIETLPDAHLLVAGDGPERERLEALAARLAPGRVTFTGALLEPITAYHAADVVILPSLGGDTMPATLIEAGLCGLPSVATPVGAIEEVVLHGRTGLIVEIGDVEGLADGVRAVTTDEALRSRFSAAARRHCQDTFAIEHVGAQWVDALQSVSSGRQVRRRTQGDRISVLAVLNSLAPGGAEASTVAMAPYLRERGIDVTIVVLKRAVPELDLSGLDDPPAVVRLQSSGLVRQVRELRAVIGNLQPDIVHSAIFDADQVARLASWRSRVPLVSSLVNTPYDEAVLDDPGVSKWKLRIVQTIDALTGRIFVDHFHAVSLGTKDANARALRIDPERITVAPRGRDQQRLGERSDERRTIVRAEFGLGADQLVILCLGRHEHQKGFTTMIEVVDELRHRRRDIALLIAGRDGNDTPRIREALNNRPDVADHVLLLGHRSDVGNLLSAADVLAIPSRYEGTAGTAIEAMAVGTPIIAHDLDGLKGVLRDAENSLIVPPGDVCAFADAIELIGDDRAKAQRLVEHAREDFEKTFAMDGAADTMAAFYQQVPARSRQGRC